MIAAFIIYSWLVFLLSCIVLWVWLRWSKRHLTREVSHLPTLLPSIPVLGSAHCLFFGLEKITKMILENLKSAVRQGEDTFAVWIGPFCCLFVCGEKDVQKILTSSVSLEKAKGYDYMKIAFGEGLITAPEKTWKIKRRHLEPLFHNRNLEDMSPVLNRSCHQLVDALARNVGGKPCNILDHLFDFTLKNALNLTFGSGFKWDARAKEFLGLSKEIEKYRTKGLDLIMTRFLTVSPYKHEFLLVKKISKYTTGWVQEVKQKNKQGLINMDISYDDANYGNKLGFNRGPINIPAAFSRLQETHPAFSNNDLESEIATFLLAGTDTISFSISFLLLCLASHETIQERVYEEIVNVLGQNSDFNLQDVFKLTYLDQVYKESQRWASLFPFVGRKTSENTTLGKCNIPAGTSVYVSIYGLHYNPKIYPDPEKFDPERFSSENSKHRGKYTFLPFGGGPRSCIAKRLANFTVLMAVVHLLRRFRITTEMNISLLRRKIVIILAVPGGMFLTLHHR